jgi:hypothetical protein
MRRHISHEGIAISLPGFTHPMRDAMDRKNASVFARKISTALTLVQPQTPYGLNRVESPIAVLVYANERTDPCLDQKNCHVGEAGVTG